MGVDISSFVNEGLGHSSYLADLGDGTALGIDPARIPTPQVFFAAEQGLRIVHTAVDVRQANEFHAGHIPDAVNLELGALPNARVSDGPVATMCGKTERAMTGASVLERGGHYEVAVLRGGYTAWSAHHETTAAR